MTNLQWNEKSVTLNEKYDYSVYLNIFNGKLDYQMK